MALALLFATSTGRAADLEAVSPEKPTNSVAEGSAEAEPVEADTREAGQVSPTETDQPSGERAGPLVGTTVGSPPKISQEGLLEMEREVFESEYRKKMITASLISVAVQTGLVAISIVLSYFVAAWDKTSSFEDAFGEKFSVMYGLFGAASVFASTSVAKTIHNMALSYRTKWLDLFLGSFTGAAVSMAISYPIYYSTDSSAAFLAVGGSTMALLPAAGLAVAAHLSKEPGMGVRLREGDLDSSTASIHFSPIVASGERSKWTGGMVYFSLSR